MGACVLCEEQITNPLSPERLQEQVTAWLYESQPELVGEFTTMSDDFTTSHKQGSDDTCLIKGVRMNICPYCYTDRVLKWLLSKKPDFAIIREFFTYFDFDAQGLGYSAEVRSLGYAL